MSDKMRESYEEFTAKFCSQPIEGIVKSRTGDSYDDRDLAIGWAIWQGSRESLVIKLPKTPNNGIGFSLFDEVKDQCKQAIEAAGLKVKS